MTAYAVAYIWKSGWDRNRVNNTAALCFADSYDPRVFSDSSKHAVWYLKQTQRVCWPAGQSSIIHIWIRIRWHYCSSVIKARFVHQTCANSEKLKLSPTCFPQPIFIHILFVRIFGFIPGGHSDLFHSVFFKKEKKNRPSWEKNVVFGYILLS